MMEKLYKLYSITLWNICQHFQHSKYAGAHYNDNPTYSLNNTARVAAIVSGPKGKYLQDAHH